MYVTAYATDFQLWDMIHLFAAILSLQLVIAMRFEISIAPLGKPD